MHPRPPAVEVARVAARLPGLSWRDLAAFTLCYTPEDFLNRPKTPAELLHEAQQGFGIAAGKLSRLDLSAPAGDQDFAFLIISAVRAFEEALDFFMAARQRRCADEIMLSLSLSRLREKIERTVETLSETPNAARVFKDRKDEAARSAARWRGKGTRGLVRDAPRNRLVFRLFDEMEAKRSAWTQDVLFADGVSELEREAFKATLHKRVREMIGLPPLSSKSASKYHRVAVAMLRDTAGVRGDFTRHPAFQVGGEFHDFATERKSYLGALSEAWVSVAKWRERDTKLSKCQKPSHKG